MSWALASSRFKRFLYATCLCLLAALFALEAKMAWYGSPTSPLSSLQSEKARPADLPPLVSQGSSVLDQAPSPLFLVFFAAVAFIARLPIDIRRLALVFSPDPVPAAPYFSPGLFFRPPPVLRLLGND